MKRRAFLSLLGLAPLAPTLAKALPDAQPLVHATGALPASDMADVNIDALLMHAHKYGLGYMITREGDDGKVEIRNLEPEEMFSRFDPPDDANEAW